VPVTVYVYEKNGLCRGEPIGTARFAALLAVPWEPYIEVVPLVATAGGPLSGTEHVYRVGRPYRPDSPWSSWEMRVDSPSHQPWEFWVQDGTTHDVWLSPD
jgi:hypothetical protein